MTYFIILFALCGLAVGSFMAMLISRLPKLILGNIEPSVLNVLLTRSKCPHCEHTLSWYELIPIVSYLYQKGRCRHCNTTISTTYPVIEILNAGLYVISFLVFGYTWITLAVMLFCSICIMLMVIDYKHYLLPDCLTLNLLWLGLLINTQALFTSPNEAIIGAALGYSCLWMINLIMLLITKKHGMGYGDFKMIAALGAWFGYQALPALILFSCLGSVFMMSISTLLGKQRWQKPFPFGPFLGLSSLIYLWWQYYPTSL